MSVKATQIMDGATPPTDARIIETVLHCPIQIHLWEDRTRGELWVPTYDPTALALLADDYFRVAGNNAVDNGQHR